MPKSLNFRTRLRICENNSFFLIKSGSVYQGQELYSYNLFVDFHGHRFGGFYELGIQTNRDIRCITSHFPQTFMVPSAIFTFRDTYCMFNPKALEMYAHVINLTVENNVRLNICGVYIHKPGKRFPKYTRAHLLNYTCTRFANNKTTSSIDPCIG